MPTIYEKLANSFPNSWKKKLFLELDYAGIHSEQEKWIGKRMVWSAILAIVFLLAGIFLMYFQLFFEFPTSLAIGILLGVISFAIFLAIFYLQLYYKVEGRSKFAEGILPEFLLLVAGNVRAGMTSFSAFRESARSEFGPLSAEIKIATTKSLGTESFTDALKQLSRRIKSKILKDNIDFFNQAARSGGRITKLLEASAADIRRNNELKKELIATTRMYVMFVAFVVVIATPLLMAVSVQFLQMVLKIQTESNVGSIDLQQFQMFGGQVSLSPDFMIRMAYILFTGNALLASLFMGVIGSGKGKNGLKYFPIMLIVSFIAFNVAKGILGGILGV